MARPIKPGFDYFPLDKDFFEDMKVRRVMHAYGIQAPTVLLCLLCNIYGDHGYYMKWDEDVCFLISDRLVGVKEVAVQDIVEKAIKVNFFNEYMFKKFKILTSNGIQGRYKEMSKRTQKAEIKKQYDISLINTTETKVNVTETRVNATETPVNVTVSTQSKVKESKVNKNKRNHQERNDEPVASSIQKPKPHDDDDFINLLTYYQQNIGQTNPVVIQQLQESVNDFTEHQIFPKESYDIVRFAIEITAKHNVHNWNYVNKILLNWQSNNLFTLANIKANQKERSNLHSSDENPWEKREKDQEEKGFWG